MADKIFCGIGKVPKNYKRGSMAECLEKGQVRYYGVKKVDDRIISMASELKKKKNKRENLIKKLTVLKVKIKKTKEKFAKEKNITDKKKLGEQGKKLLTEYNDMYKIYTQIEKERNKPLYSKTTKTTKVTKTESVKKSSKK